jgi:hypothetical protein
MTERKAKARARAKAEAEAEADPPLLAKDDNSVGVRLSGGWARVGVTETNGWREFVLWGAKHFCKKLVWKGRGGILHLSDI